MSLTVRDCETQAVEHLGDRAFCYLRTSIWEVVVLAPSAEARQRGELQLSLSPADLRFFGVDGQAVAPIDHSDSSH